MNEKGLQQLSIYETHGFERVGETDVEVYGYCIFCSKDQHFYINRKSGQFDCKSCGVSGNAISFLGKVLDHYYRRTRDIRYRSLASERGLLLETLKEYKLAWDGSRWLIPCISENLTIRDLRYYYPNKKLGVRSTKGCKVQLFGMDELANLDPGGSVYLCEGEWDTLSLAGLLRQIDLEDTNWAVVGVPGAGTFKDSWVDFMRGHNVTVCYDNDAPGTKGKEKVLRMLNKKAKSLKCIAWPSEYPEGFDVRDFVSIGRRERKEPETIFKELTNLVEIPRAIDIGGSVIESGDSRSTVYEIGSISSASVPSFDETVKVFEKWVSMSNDMIDALRIIYATSFAVSIPGDPLWMYLVGPPGCGKTLLLMSLQGSDRCIFNSTLTPHSLVSGFGHTSGDPSVLPLWNGRCAVLKDFTEILAAHPQAREELYGTLRGAYDGHVKKAFGNGITREYRLSFSLIAGTTPAIHGDKMAMMGERFLKYELFRESDWSADNEIRAALGNIAKEKSMEHELIDISGRFLSRELTVDNLPGVPVWVVNRMVALAQLVACLRANVERETFGDQRLKYRPTREVGTRLAKQLVKLGQLLSFVDGQPEIDQKAYSLVEQVAFDTTIGFHLDIIQALMMSDGHVSTRNALAKRCLLPETTLYRALEDLLALGIVDRVRKDTQLIGRPEMEWHVCDWAQDLWNRSEIGQDHVERLAKAKEYKAGKRRKRRLRVLKSEK